MGGGGDSILAESVGTTCEATPISVHQIRQMISWKSILLLYIRCLECQLQSSKICVHYLPFHITVGFSNHFVAAGMGMPFSLLCLDRIFSLNASFSSEFNTKFFPCIPFLVSHYIWKVVFQFADAPCLVVIVIRFWCLLDCFYLFILGRARDKPETAVNQSQQWRKVRQFVLHVLYYGDNITYDLPKQGIILSNQITVQYQALITIW